MKFVLQWIDLAWLVLALCVARRDQRWWVAGFFVGCMLMMRMMAELMESIGHPYGLVGFMSSPVHTRALVVFSSIYVLYMAFIYYAPTAKGTLLMATSIVFFFAAFFVSAFVIVL